MGGRLIVYPMILGFLLAWILAATMLPRVASLPTLVALVMILAWVTARRRRVPKRDLINHAVSGQQEHGEHAVENRAFEPSFVVDWAEIAPELRLGLRLCYFGLALIYGVGFCLKSYGLVPPHVSWFGLTVAPIALLGPLAALFAGLLWLRDRWWLLFLPVGIMAVTAMVGLYVY